METIEEIKNKINEKLSELQKKVRVKDPIYDFLSKDPIGEYIFDTNLRMLPYELVEKYGARILQDVMEYNKYKDLKYDVFYVEWEKHLKGYHQDRLQLLEEYLKPVIPNETCLDVFNRLSDLMIKIERRSLLLQPDPKVVEQRHFRLSGAEKDYKFIRTYWLTEKGEKKRMISRPLSDRYMRLEREVGDLFHNRGYAVHRNYRSANGDVYDLVIELEGMKTVVEVKMVNEEIFNMLFMFDALLKQYEIDYPNNK